MNPTLSYSLRAGYTRSRLDDVETALEITARGLADTIANRGMPHGMADGVPPNLLTTPLQPPMWDSFAVVHEQIDGLASLRVRDQVEGLDKRPGGGDAPKIDGPLEPDERDALRDPFDPSA
jgi:hypothetical protein